MGFTEYKNNGFQLEKASYWYSQKQQNYSITQMDIRSNEVWLPDTYNYGCVIELDIRSDNIQVYKKARVLHIPAAIKNIWIRNDIFPELERVEIDFANPYYTTDGQMIFSDKGRKLEYCPVCKGDHLIIPDHVKDIGPEAFRGTMYQMIQFPKSYVNVDHRAFDHSRWLEAQGDMAIIGSMLYKASCNRSCLNVPPGIKRFHRNLFGYENTPDKMISSFLPNRRDMYELNKYARCRSFTITSPQANINIKILSLLDSLEEVHLPDGHKKYKSLDGIVYSQDGRMLVWYPSSRKSSIFTVPDGVKKIGEAAFANQQYLEEIHLPDSVCIVSSRAFMKCVKLNLVHLSPNIREISDSSAFQSGGVFEGCEKLTHITLTEKLIYLGSFAFYNSGLTSIQLNPKLEQMGEYALMAEHLKKVALPPSVKRLGKGSLFYCEEVKAYEGTAKSLVAAVNTVFPDMKANNMNMKWKRCLVTVLHRRSEKQEHFLIPGSLKRSAAYHLDMAWNADVIDYEEYDECLSEISDSGEKLEFAAQGLLRYQSDEDNPYSDYLRQVSYKLGYLLLENKKEKEFLLFLKQGFLSQNSLSKLLKFSNQQSMTVCSAYIIEVQNKNGKKNSSLRL